MWPRAFTWAGLLLFWGTVTGAQDIAAPVDEPAARVAAKIPAAEPAPAALPPPIFHRQPTFYIPFSVHSSPAAAIDVILFVSADYGAKWDPYARQPASQNHFLVRAARDGEYWFASRTLPAGAQVPDGLVLAAELRIIVDTTEPKLSLDAKVDSNGEVVTVWEVYDEWLDTESVTLQYQAGPGQSWQPVDIQRAVSGDAVRTLRGETRWKPERVGPLLSVKLQARDRAANIQEVTRRLLPPISLPSPFGQPPQMPSDVPADPFAAHGTPPADPKRPKPLPLPPVPDVESPSPTAQPSDAAGAAVWPSDSSGESEPHHAHRYASTPSPVGPLVTQQAEAAVRSPEAMEPREAEPRLADTRTGADAEPAAGIDAGMPPGERPRMTSSRRFNLDYSIDAVGPSGVDKVELWVTRNGGRDWDLWDVYKDGQNPLLVEVKDEGIYGFRVVIVGANGLTSRTPRAGDPADLWVGVDTTSPVVEITSAAYGSGEYAGQLDIRWTAYDANLASRPVTLSFSDNADGPWSTIASGLPNTGQYHWRVDSRVPEAFFLRIEVRDEAGNIGAAQLKQPIQSAGLTPRGRIRAVEPVAN